MTEDDVREAAEQAALFLVDARPPELSDEALALEFARAHQDTLRYCAAWSRWLVFDGVRWADDARLRHYDLARTVCRAAASKSEKPSVQRAICSAKTVAAVERLARADQRLASVVDQWDADPMLLNTPDGVVDLRTGRLRPHRHTDYMMRCTTVGPGGDCPLWLEFLRRITDGSASLQQFLQRMAGYALTGQTIEQCLFFLYGTGANGKSTFLDTFTNIMGEYALVSSMETFTESRNDRHPTELAVLRGARLVTAAETEAGRRWAEARIKSLTGGEKISARFMRGDPFEFKPQFKLMIAGNHKPALRNVDEAMRRRLNMLPFEVRIPPEERDGRLAEKLKLEWPGILQWAIEGCLAWQEQGLGRPPEVVEATAEYVEGEDSFGAWLDECTNPAMMGWERVAHLYASWKKWADTAGESAGTAKAFSQAMQERGYRRAKKHGVRGFDGIDLIRENLADDPRYGG